MLIAGKGHEAYQIIGTEKRPFDDSRGCAQALAKRAGPPDAHADGRRGRRFIRRPRWSKATGRTRAPRRAPRRLRRASAPTRGRSRPAASSSRCRASASTRTASSRRRRRARRRRARWCRRRHAPGAVPRGFALFEVPDTLEALGALARFHRRRFTHAARRGRRQQREDHHQGDGRAPSSPTRGPALKTEGNLNNEVGRAAHAVPPASPSTWRRSIEMGMNHPGEIEPAHARSPSRTRALITVVQPEHLEGLGSIEGVARGRGRAVPRAARRAPPRW